MMKPIEHDTAIDWLKQTCAVIREMDAENKKLKKAIIEADQCVRSMESVGLTHFMSYFENESEDLIKEITKVNK